MSQKILIVEDQFIEANNLQMILEKSGYSVCGIARSVKVALELIAQEVPDLVLLDIFLQGNLTGIDLAAVLQKKHIAFVYLSANSDKDTLDAAKATRPYGFLVKPYREKDVLITMDIAWYLHACNQPAAPQHTLSPAVAPVNASHAVIGKSKAITDVLHLAETVAATDTSVLITGESGTGKERIAQYIHQLSRRSRQPLVTINCAALPATLIESELFGHEKGAFTGAYEKRIGKFEQASGGTIFLDEIGEMPTDLQVKLLRVLQEKEIERLGGRETIKTDVRIIAATNKNLQQEMAEGHFRIDLFYRLNVFPIHLPSLRERKEDILSLTQYFMQQSSLSTGKVVTGISVQAQENLLAYSWPGNIRELENIVERSVLLAESSIIQHFPLSHSHALPSFCIADGRIKSIEENERDYIIQVLNQCNGKIFGKGGAAELLGINVSTLNSKIKKLGIDKNNLTGLPKNTK